MSDTPTIRVRKATLEDHQAVLDINHNVYNGADYVILYYKDLVTDPDSSYYVCEVDGEVAAFEGVCLIDDKKTLMTRAARVKDKFLGQGLLQYLRKQIHADYKDIPGEKRIRTCCTNMVRLVNSDRFRSQNKILAMKTLDAYDFLHDLKIPSPYCDNIPEVSELDVEDLPLLIQDKHLVDYLFPEGYISAISWFFEPLVSNIRHIKKQFPYISISATLEECVRKLQSSSEGSKLAGSSAASTCMGGNQQCLRNQEDNSGIIETHKGDDSGNGTTHKGDNFEIVKKDACCLPQGLMALSAHYFSPAVFHYVIDIYGTPRLGQEEEDIRRIVLHSLKHAVELINNHEPKVPLFLGFSMKYGTDVEVYHKILFPLGFKQSPSATQYKTHYYFEQNFDQLLTS